MVFCVRIMFSLYCQDDKNSTTTVHPTIRHGIEGIGLLFNNDPNCLRVEFNSDDTLASFISIGCSGPDIIKVGYRQTYKQYLDGGGGAYCLIEQSSAVELSLPYQVSQTSGPVMQEVLHRYAYSSGLTQRTRIIQNDPTVSECVVFGRCIIMITDNHLILFLICIQGTCHT